MQVSLQLKAACLSICITNFVGCTHSCIISTRVSFSFITTSGRERLAHSIVCSASREALAQLIWCQRDLGKKKSCQQSLGVGSGGDSVGGEGSHHLLLLCKLRSAVCNCMHCTAAWCTPCPFTATWHWSSHCYVDAPAAERWWMKP